MIEPVPDKGDYKEFKRYVLEQACVPVIGRVYRLLQDDFATAWKLINILDIRKEARVMTCCFQCFPEGDAVHLVKPSDWAVTTYVAFSPAADSWEASVACGKVVEDGHDLPPGRIRDWAIGRGNEYVLKFDFERVI